MVEVVGRTQVERLAFLRPAISPVHRWRAAASGCGPPKRRPSWTMAVVHVGRQLGHRAGDLAAPAAVPAEEHGEAADQVADLRSRSRRGRGGRKPGMPLRLQRGEVRAAVVFPHAVQQQRHLAVVRDDLVLLEELDQVGEAGGLVAVDPCPRWR